MSWLFLECGRECTPIISDDEGDADGDDVSGLVDVTGDDGLVADGDDGSYSSSSGDGDDLDTEEGSEFAPAATPQGGTTKTNMEVNYDEIVPPLFAYMQSRQWNNVVEEAERDPSQARYWVYRFQRDDRTRIRWRMLPCHAAVIFRCPPHVLRAVVESYPEGCAQFDDQDLLPIHLAYKNKLAFRDNETLGILLKAYPKGVMTKDGRGRLPNDYLNKRSRCSRGSRYTGDGEGSYDDDDASDESDYSDMDVMSYFSDCTEDTDDSGPRLRIPPPPPPRRQHQQQQGEDDEEEGTTASAEERRRIAQFKAEEEAAAERERMAAASRVAAKLAAKEVLDELEEQRKRDAAEKKRALAERKRAEKRLAAEGKKRAQMAKEEAERTKRQEQEEAERTKWKEKVAERKKLQDEEAERKQRKDKVEEAATAVAVLAEERRQNEEAEERKRRKNEKREAEIARVVTQEATVEATISASEGGEGSTAPSSEENPPRGDATATVVSAPARNDGGNRQKGNPPLKKKSFSSTSPSAPLPKEASKPSNKWKRTLSKLKTRSGKTKGPGKPIWNEAPSPCNTVDSYDMDQSVAVTRVTR